MKEFLNKNWWTSVRIICENSLMNFRSNFRKICKKYCRRSSWMNPRSNLLGNSKFHPKFDSAIPSVPFEIHSLKIHPKNLSGAPRSYFENSFRNFCPGLLWMFLLWTFQKFLLGYFLLRNYLLRLTREWTKSFQEFFRSSDISEICLRVQGCQVFLLRFIWSSFLWFFFSVPSEISPTSPSWILFGTFSGSL